ncbi:MAG: AI-2E family transporter [Marinilabiliales bacterium]|nr:AI-2E family transporter [Marinilabiliales bacterium]
MDHRLRTAIVIVALILFGLLCYYMTNIVAYILIAAVMSLVGSPLTRKFLKIRFGRFQMGETGAAVCTLITLWAGFIAFFSFLIPMVVSEVQQLSNINIPEIVNYLKVSYEQLAARYPSLISNITQSGNLEEYAKTQLTGFVNFGQVTSVFGSIATVVGNLFLMFFSVSFILFFFLKEDGLFGSWILVLSPDKYSERVEKLIREIGQLIRRYLVGLLLQMASVMVLSTIGFTVIGLGFSHAVVVGVFAGLINVIPYIGPWIGALFALVVAVASNLNASFVDVTLPLMGLILVVVMIVQFIDNMVIQTLIFSNSVQAHPLEIFFVTMIAGSLAGIPGMILGIPAYTVLRTIASEFLSEFKVIRSLTKSS